MKTLRKISVAVDFSHASQAALEFGRLLSDATGAALHLVHVIPYPLEHPETLPAVREAVCRRLDALLDSTDRRHRHASTTCLVGSAASALAGHAGAREIDLLVLGTHHHDASIPSVASSTASAVVGMAPCAVLAVKSRAPAALTSDPPPAIAAAG